MTRFKTYRKERAFDENERTIESEEIEKLKERFEDEGKLDPDAAVQKVIEQASKVWIPSIKPKAKKMAKKPRRRPRSITPDLPEKPDKKKVEEEEEVKIPEEERKVTDQQVEGTGGLTDGKFRVEFRQGFKRKTGGIGIFRKKKD